MKNLLISLLFLALTRIAVAQVPLAVDATAQGAPTESGNGCSVTLTTIHPGDRIILNVADNSRAAPDSAPDVMVYDDANLPWERRAAVSASGKSHFIFEFDTVASKVLTEDEIAFVDKNGVAGHCVVTAIAISGRSRFDKAGPKVATTEPIEFSPQDTSALVIGLFRTTATTAGECCATLLSRNFQMSEIVTSPGQPISLGTGTPRGTNAGIVDALDAVSGVGAERYDMLLPTNYFGEWGKDGYWFENNIQGARSIQQRITFDPETFPSDTELAWQIVKCVGICGYPCVIYGALPGQQSGYVPPNLNAPRPLQVDSLRALSAAANIEASGPSFPNDVAVFYDIWLTSDPAFTLASRKFEVQIGLHVPPRWLAHASATYTMSSPILASVYTTKNSDGWTQIGIVPKSDMLNASVDLKRILLDLRAHGLISGREYVGGVPLGCETVAGDGACAIKSFAVSWK